MSEQREERERRDVFLWYVVNYWRENTLTRFGEHREVYTF